MKLYSIIHMYFHNILRFCALNCQPPWDPLICFNLNSLHVCWNQLQLLSYESNYIWLLHCPMPPSISVFFCTFKCPVSSSEKCWCRVVLSLAITTKIPLRCLLFTDLDKIIIIIIILSIPILFIWRCTQLTQLADSASQQQPVLHVYRKRNSTCRFFIQVLHWPYWQLAADRKAKH